jgi:hypothetical protein
MGCGDLAEAGLNTVMHDVEYDVRPIMVFDLEHHRKLGHDNVRHRDIGDRLGV